MYYSGMGKNKKRDALIGIIAIVVIVAAVSAVYFYMGGKLFNTTLDYKNTRFGYEAKLPAGWKVYAYSYEPDVSAQLTQDPKYKDVISKYADLDELKQKDPQLFETMKGDYTRVMSAWVPEKAETIVFTNGDQSYSNIFGPDKIDLFVTSHDAGYVDQLKELSTDSEDREKIALANGTKAYLRKIHASGMPGTVVIFQFDGKTPTFSGGAGNTAMLVLSGKLDPELLIGIANSFIATKN